MATLNEIIARAEALRKESYVNSIDPERVGSIMSDTLKYLNEFQLQSGSMGLDKIYTSISAMNSDNAPVSDLTGKPLKGGQLAVIVAGSASEDNGKVYRFDNPGWTYVSTIGNLNIVQETGDSETAVMSQKAVTNLIEELKNAGYVFAGIATPETNPGTPDQNVFYIASENGTYSNFGGVTLTDEVAIFSNTNGSWVKSETGIATSAKVAELLNILYLDKRFNRDDTILSYESVNVGDVLYFELNPGTGLKVLDKDGTLIDTYVASSSPKGYIPITESFGSLVCAYGGIFKKLAINDYNIALANNPLVEISDNPNLNAIVREMWCEGISPEDIKTISFYKIYKNSSGKYVNSVIVNGQTLLTNTSSDTEEEAIRLLTPYVYKDGFIHCIVDWNKVPKGVSTIFRIFNLKERLSDLDFAPSIKNIKIAASVGNIQGNITDIQEDITGIQEDITGIQEDIKEKGLASIPFMMFGVYGNDTAINCIHAAGRNVYIGETNRIKKIDFGVESDPTLQGTLSLSSYLNVGRGSCRNIQHSNGILYSAFRQYSAGPMEIIRPEIRICFEQNYSQYSASMFEDSTLSSFFKSLDLENGSTPLNIYIRKAHLQDDGKYRNQIYISFGNRGCSFATGNYDSEEAALEALQDEYTDPDYSMFKCVVDWNILESNTYRSFYNVKSCINGFNSYTENGATINDLGIKSPNSLHSAKLATGEIVSESSALLKRSLKTSVTECFLSAFINIPNIVDADIDIPVLMNNDTEVVSIRIGKAGSTTYNLGVVVNGSYYNGSSVNLSGNEWYNIKLHISPTKVELWYREKELPINGWKAIVTRSIENSSSINVLALGITTSASNSCVYIDDYYYNPTELDDVEYINGTLVLSDVNNNAELLMKKAYGVDLKCSEIAIHEDLLILSCLRGINFYDISTPDAPKLVYVHRYDANYFNGYDVPAWSEYQGGTVWSAPDGKKYYAAAMYHSSFIVFEITDKSDIKFIKQVELDSVGTQFTFDLVAIYPYLYVTLSVHSTDFGGDNDNRGILRYDISNLEDITNITTLIDKADYAEEYIADPAPTRIAKYNGLIIVNNGDKGYAVFDVSGNIPVYKGLLIYDNGGVSYPIEETKDGRLLLGYGGKNNDNYYDLIVCRGVNFLK